MKDHYTTLGIERGATPLQIKQAYRELSVKWHPDKHPGNAEVEEKFKHIILAYKVLSDPEKRVKYDLGFDADSGSFDPRFVDPSLLDPEKFMQMFVGLFGEYLDARIPGGFRERVNRAANLANNKNKTSPKAKKKTKNVVCQRCKDTGRIVLRQGQFTVFVSCVACEKRKAC